MRAAPMLRILLLLTLLDGCVYSTFNLHHGTAGYKNYPTSIEDEHHRRSSRRTWALLAAPLEIVGGLALSYVALKAPSSPSDAMTVGGQLEDAGKEVLARAILAGIGITIAGSGVGDGILGATDPAFRSPIIRHGKLIPESEIDHIAPPAGPRLAFHGTNVLGSAGVGADLGFGLAHWVTPTIRLRHAASAEVGEDWHADDRRLIVSVETLVERAFGREGAGLYPKKSIGLFFGGGYSISDHAEDLPIMRGGLSFGLSRSISYRLGTSYSPGDRHPSLDLGMRMELRVD
jgi:hypothetical protein